MTKEAVVQNLSEALFGLRTAESCAKDVGAPELQEKLQSLRQEVELLIKELDREISGQRECGYFWPESVPVWEH